MIHEFRRARRRKAADTIVVTDAMTDRVFGRIGNLSQTGMLLIASEPLTDDALYQFRFSLPAGDDDHATVDVGAHLLWQDVTGAPGRCWAGFRFIAMQEDHARRIHAWIEAPGGRFE